MQYGNLTVGQWQMLKNALDIDNATERVCAVIGVIEGIPVQQVKQWKLSQIADKVASYPAFNDNDLLSKPKRKVKVGDKEYRVCFDLTDLCAGQLIDFMELNKQDGQDNAHMILAVLMMEGKEYDAAGLTARAKYIQDHMKMIDAYPISFFLRNRSLKLLEGIQDCLSEEAKKAKKELKVLKADGVGSH